MDRVSTQYRYDSPSHEVNVEGTRRLVEAVRGAKIRLIHVSTKDVFGDVYEAGDVTEQALRYEPKFRIDDTQRFKPETVYAKSKLISEFICEAHPRTTVIRLSSCYTDLDHRPEKNGGNWVVTMTRSILKGQKPRLTGTGKQIRDLLHAEDLGRLLQRVFELPAAVTDGLRMNAGGGVENTLSLLEFIREVDPAMGYELVSPERGRPDYGFAFNNRVAEGLGWRPEIRIRLRLPVIRENVRRGLG
jgi:dTDP-glucose 4,6-dehydratase